MPDLTLLVVIAAVLIGGWFLLRMALQLTAALFRIGCLLIFLLLVGAGLYLFVIGPV